ncbi:MAG: MBL fold metallo-hydrolase [Candidatus Heimdallarchaeota archaeon]|nr:MBL fold metallo-hydrolase [Candidatus Heimdallarchaeota archaeon]
MIVVKMEVESKIKEITERTFLGRTVIDGKRQSNAGAILLKDSLFVFDPSPEAATGKTFRKLIEEKSGLPTKYLAISHYHWDHIFGAKAFEDVTIIGSEKLLQILEYLIKNDWKHKVDNIVLPKIVFKEKLIIQDDGISIELQHTGGHTECSIFAYVPEEKVLFTGDLVFAKLFPWAGDRTCNPDQWINIFKQWLDLDFEYVVPGHGPLTGKSEIMKQLRNLKNLRSTIIDAIADNVEISKIELPPFYEPLSESSRTRTIEHFYRFYANQEK